MSEEPRLQTTLPVALKEWHATIDALQQGRQIVLLRKGGLLDAEGTFQMESSTFWLAPTRFHQDENLIKPQHRDLLHLPQAPSREVLVLPAWAHIEKVWAIDLDDAEKLVRLDHIWSTHWLDTRFDYQREKPLQVLALRVWNLEEPHRVAWRPEYSGCKSWIELEAGLETTPSRPALSDAAFAVQLKKMRSVLEC